RFAGGPIVARVGRSRVLMVSALFAAVGLALVAYVDHQAVAVTAVVLWGLGASLGFPLALSAAGDSGPNPAARVALASIIGYLAFLVGPPLLGFLGEAVGLRGALTVPLGVVLIAAVLAPATRPSRPTAAEHEGSGPAPRALTSPRLAPTPAPPSACSRPPAPPPPCAWPTTPRLSPPGTCPRGRGRWGRASSPPPTPGPRASWTSRRCATPSPEAACCGAPAPS